MNEIILFSSDLTHDYPFYYSSPIRMKFAFMMYDEESTGSITHRELVKILRANHMARSEGEVARKAETILAQCDKRNDGSITFEEFVVVSTKFPNILFPAQNNQS